VLSAQLFRCAALQFGDVESQFAAGDFRPLRDWLDAAIYRRGKCWTTPELCREVCGDGLDPQVLLRTLRAKHERLWQ
jgi:carboxypeptidase Taq